MLLSHFPRGMTPRENQRVILNDMDELLKSGYKKFIISAPTGSGKSHIAAALASALHDAFIITSTKQLQDQYAGDFPYMPVIKGKSNFECYQLMERAGVVGKRRAFLKRLTCEKGQCMIKRGGKVVDVCKFKASGQDRQCTYYKQKDEGLRNNRTVLNYAMYFYLKKFQNTTPGVDRRAVIFDEAHTIENEVVRFIGYDVLGSYLEEARLDQRRFDMESPRGMVRMLDSLKDAYADLIQRSSSPVTAGDVMRLRRLDRRLESIVNARRDINRNADNFIMQEPQFDEGGRFKRVSAVPLDITGYTRDLFDSEIQVFMSATIDKTNFSKIMGLKNCAFIDVPKSPFPAESRRVVFRNVARLSSRSPESDETRVAAEIDRILAKHNGSRGLILTSSKARCYNLLRKLSRRQARRIELAHSKNEDNSTMEEVLEVHGQTRNGVLLSSSLWQGIDLKGDLSRFQIVEKCPFPYLGDARVAAKNRADRTWYAYQTIVKILQGLGRSVRDVDDRAVTYVMDSAVRDLLVRYRTMVPSAYHDVLFAR